ncbi:hypothetical protein [Sphingomonas sp.]
MTQGRKPNCGECPLQAMSRSPPSGILIKRIGSKHREKRS